MDTFFAFFKVLDKTYKSIEKFTNALDRLKWSIIVRLKPITILFVDGMAQWIVISFNVCAKKSKTTSTCLKFLTVDDNFALSE